jgi:hypothetical protein
VAATGPRYSKAEFAKRGDKIYDRAVDPHLNAEDDGKFVAVDIETGAYEIDADDLTACHRLRKRVPDAQIWLVQAGKRYRSRFGMR